MRRLFEIPHFATLYLAAMLLGLMLAASTASADGTETITFDPAPVPNGSKSVASWVEQDFQFSTPYGLTINDVSNDTYPYNGTAYLQCLYGESPLKIVTVDGQPFSLITVDLAEYSTVFDTPKAITFAGTHTDGSTTSVTFTTDGTIDGNGPAQDFQTFSFPDTFVDLNQVTVATDRYSMDNLQVVLGSSSPTPTPTPTPPQSLAPVITSATTVSAKVDQPFAYQIIATHAPTEFRAESLPGDLVLNHSTGLISGTLTATGSFQVSVAAVNAVGIGSATLTINVSVAPAPTPVVAPAITSATRATAQVGQPFVYLITATNAPTTFTAGGLPDGFSVDPNGGLISGTPTATGMYDIALGASNSGGSGTALLTLNVTAAPPSVTVGVLGSGDATEGGAAGKVVFRRVGSTDAGLTVNYKVKGSAVAGVDYKALSGTVTIPAGSAQAKIKIKATGHERGDNIRTVKIKLVPSADGSYTLGAATMAKLKITGGD